MAHPRQAIGEKVVSLLKVAATAVGDNVFLNKAIALRPGQLPALIVFTPSETSDSEGTAPRELRRDLKLEVEAVVTVDDEAASTLNDLLEEAERVMHADPTLAGLAGDSELKGTDLAVGQEGNVLTLSGVLTYAVVYHTLAPEPPADGAMDDFVTVGADHDAAGAVASDLFDVQVLDES